MRPRDLFIPEIHSASEALELLRTLCVHRMGAYERAKRVARVVEWIGRREQDIADIEHGAAWLLLQGAQLVGEDLRRQLRRKEPPSTRLHLIGE